MKKLTLNSFHNLSSRDLALTIPTYLTIARMFLIPWIVIAMVSNQWGTAFTLFLVSGVTDILDGFLARRFDCRTFLGACLDPIADKLLILSVFFTLVFVQPGLFALPLWFVLLVLIKELLLICGAVTIFIVRGSLRVEPTWLGKATMVAQTSFIIWLFACYFFNWLPYKTYYGMLGVLLTLVLLSLIQYASIGLRSYGKNNN